MVGKKGVKVGKKHDVQITERKEQTLADRIKALEDEISTTKYNKRTQHAVGLLKAKLAMLKETETRRASVGKAKGDDRFSVRKTGDGSVVLLGYPSVGKSTLLNKLTNAKSDIAAYNFTTVSAVPGILQYKQAKIQIIDVPGIVSGAAAGTGRGKEVLAMLRNADLILILVDALAPKHYESILSEIYDTGIRVNQNKPDVRIAKKERGGIFIASTVKVSINKETIAGIARELKLANADILIRDTINEDQLIDVIEGNKVYTPAITIITKMDLVDSETLRSICQEVKPDLAISAEVGTNIEQLKDLIFTRMRFIRIFLKEVNKRPDMEEPLIMQQGCTIRAVCLKLHKDFVSKFKFVRIWGPSAKFEGQVLRNLDKQLQDKDILELHIK
ncbi:MAG TPA: GTPase [Candidatus Nanoarchaeia archaeon]|nr:GTPase [Candidatus Nanoarchaeia archaeon]